MAAASAPCSAIVPFAATGPAAALQALADDRMKPVREIAFPDSAVGNVCIQQLPGMALGAYAWAAGMELVAFIERTFGESLRGLRVLELGSGTGLTAIALARLGARVHATDCMPDLVKLARRNISTNGLAREQCTAHLYTWGDPLRAALAGGFDLVLGSEVTALESGHTGLLATLKAAVDVSRESGWNAPRIFMAETRRNSAQPMFWARALEDFEVSELAAVTQSDAWNTLDRNEPVRVIELRAKSSVELGTPTDVATSSSLPPTSSVDAEAMAEANFASSDRAKIASASLAGGQPYEEVFRSVEKLDAYAMSFDDLEVFKAHGYAEEDIGKLSTYGSVLHHGVPLLFQAIADRAYAGDLRAAVDGKVFLDLGSAEGRCVISAALHFCRASAEGSDEPPPMLKRAVGVELSTLRHGLALKYRERLAEAAARERVQLVQDDILSPGTAELLAEADVVYAANLRFPGEVNQRLGAHVAASLDPARDCFVLELAPLSFPGRVPAATWEVSVPMSWNPGGWPVHCHFFPARTAKAAS